MSGMKWDLIVCLFCHILIDLITILRLKKTRAARLEKVFDFQRFSNKRE